MSYPTVPGRGAQSRCHQPPQPQDSPLPVAVQPNLLAQVAHNVGAALRLQAAIADTEVPAVSVVEASEADGEPELDVDDEESTTLDVTGMPMIVTVGQVSCGPQHPS